MTTFFVLCLLCPVFSSFLDDALEITTVNTPSGRISGKIMYHDLIPVKAYLGIPFAKPPVGNLRFKPTVPVEPWTTTLEATTFGSGCPQFSPDPYATLDRPPGLSEDCLTLNIWVPVSASFLTKKSVMFFLHTGAFYLSSSRVEFYHGQVLAADGDVIVVTTNYRLGALGFFYSATEDAPGNVGMLDMVESLKWVRKNIGSFGGDIDSITVFGHSAGGIATGMFCVSPLTRGLFRRVILQSGSPASLYGEDNERDFKVSQQLSEVLGCTNDGKNLENNPEAVVSCMRDVNAMELAIKLDDIRPEIVLRPFYPRYGDDFLPQNPRLAISEGDFEPMDVLIGNTNGDGSDLIIDSMQDVFGFYGQKYPQINRTFGASIIRRYFQDYPDPDSVVEQYLGGLKEDDYYEIRHQVLIAAGDYLRICPSVYFAESFAKKNSHVYFYLFTHRPKNSPFAPYMLAVHFEEVPFVFGYPLRYPQNYTLAEQLLSRRLIADWSHFAKTGHPELGVWPLYSKQNPYYQVLDTNTAAVRYGPHRNNCDFFRSTFGF